MMPHTSINGAGERSPSRFPLTPQTMARTIYVEFAVSIPDDADNLETISGMEVSISGENVLRWELAHVCDDDAPIVSNFLR